MRFTSRDHPIQPGLLGNTLSILTCCNFLEGCISWSGVSNIAGSFPVHGAIGATFESDIRASYVSQTRFKTWILNMKPITIILVMSIATVALFIHHHFLFISEDYKKVNQTKSKGLCNMQCLRLLTWKRKFVMFVSFHECNT